MFTALVAELLVHGTCRWLHRLELRFAFFRKTILRTNDRNTRPLHHSRWSWMILSSSFELIYLMACNKKQIIQLFLLVKTKAAIPAQSFTNTAQYNYYQQVHSQWFFKFLCFWTSSTVSYLQQNIFNNKRWTNLRDIVTLSKLASVWDPRSLYRNGHCRVG